MNHSVRQAFDAPQNQENRNRVKNDSNRLTYHLMAPVGWLNDPNGLCELDGVNHIFYQYTPGDPKGQDHRGWGHYTTKDFVHYQEENDPFVPDTFADGKGSYSGSALVKDGKMHLFFTGNNKLPGDYDYINDGRIHWVLHSESKDNGKTFSEKEVLLKNEDYPQNLSCHVRDPKILWDKDKWVMVLGARTKDSIGQAELFESEDLKHWKHMSTIRSKKPFGYMWECPDLFDLDNQRILICCPQGIREDGFENKDANGWTFVKGPLDHDQTVGEFTPLDYGFDFYAPQTYLDEKGRRILISWMAIPDVDYTNPTTEHGWQHALSLPRELQLKHGKLYQYPIVEIEQLRESAYPFELTPKGMFVCNSKAVELDLHPQGKEWTIRLRQDVELHYANGLFTLRLGKSGYGRTERHVRIDAIDSLQIFSDTSSLEIFLNHGEKVLTTRVYDEDKHFTLETDTALTGTAWRMSGFVVEEKLDKVDPTNYAKEGKHEQQ